MRHAGDVAIKIHFSRGISRRRRLTAVPSSAGRGTSGIRSVYYTDGVYSVYHTIRRGGRLAADTRRDNDDRTYPIGRPTYRFANYSNNCETFSYKYRERSARSVRHSLRPWSRLNKFARARGASSLLSSIRRDKHA